MEKHIFAYTGTYQNFGQALNVYPDNPDKCRYDVQVVNLGKLSEQQCETLFAACPHVNFVALDELHQVQKTQALAKVPFWDERPSNVPIRAVLLQPLRAARALREKRIEDEVYYLYVRVDEGYNDYNIRSCVKVVGKTQAIAALSYAKQNTKRLLEERKSWGYDDWVTYVGATDVEDKAELEGVALATEKFLLGSGKNIDDADFAMFFARDALDFCRGTPPTNLLIAPELNVAPPIFVAASGKGNLKTANVRDDKFLKAIENNTAVLNEIKDKIPDRNAIYEGNVMAAHVNDVDKWHMLSVTKYDGAGWADITDVCYPKLRLNMKALANKAKHIEREVKALRKKISDDDF